MRLEARDAVHFHDAQRAGGIGLDVDAHVIEAVHGVGRLRAPAACASSRARAGVADLRQPDAAQVGAQHLVLAVVLGVDGDEARQALPAVAVAQHQHGELVAGQEVLDERRLPELALDVRDLPAQFVLGRTRRCRR